MTITDGGAPPCVKATTRAPSPEKERSLTVRPEACQRMLSRPVARSCSLITPRPAVATRRLVRGEKATCAAGFPPLFGIKHLEENSAGNIPELHSPVKVACGKT